MQFVHQDGTLKTPQSRADSWDILQPRFQDPEFFVPLISQCGLLTSDVLVMKHPWNNVLGISTPSWYSSSTYCASVVCTDKLTEEGEKYKVILAPVSIMGTGNNLNKHGDWKMKNVNKS